MPTTLRQCRFMRRRFDGRNDIFVTVLADKTGKLILKVLDIETPFGCLLPET